MKLIRIVSDEIILSLFQKLDFISLPPLLFFLIYLLFACIYELVIVKILQGGFFCHRVICRTNLHRLAMKIWLRTGAPAASGREYFTSVWLIARLINFSFFIRTEFNEIAGSLHFFLFLAWLFCLFGRW